MGAILGRNGFFPLCGLAYWFVEPTIKLTYD